MSTSGANITRYAGGGKNDGLGGSAAATSVRLGVPAGLFVSSMGDLYISDNTKFVIRKVSHFTANSIHILTLMMQVDSAGSMTTFAGIGHYGYDVVSVPALSAQLRYPTGIVGSADGTTFFITDNQNNVVRKVQKR